METWYEIGDAEPHEMSFIEELAATASLHTLDALRHTTEDRATYVRSEFAELKSYVRRGLYRFLVARDKASGEPIGYLLLNLYHQDDLGRRQTFVEDIAAIPGGFVTVGFNRTVFRALEADPADVAQGDDGTSLETAVHTQPVHGFPNPTDGLTTLSFRAESSGTYTISVFDVTGRLESSWSEFVAKGSGSVRWQAPGTGTWFVRVQDPAGGTHIGRIVRYR